MATLPVELVFSLLDHAYYGDPRYVSAFVDRESISACALVCRAWTPYAQSLLFRHANLRTPEAIAAFLHAVRPSSSSPRAFALANAVRILEMNVIRSLNSFISVVSQLPNVRELILRLGLPRPICENELIALRTPPANLDPSLPLSSYTNPLQILRITAKGRNVPTPIFQLLSLYPSLKLLDIRGTLDFTPPASPNTLRPRFALQELQCSLPFWNEEAADEFFSLLLESTAPGSLQILGLHDLPSNNAVLESIIERHGPYLRSLRFAFNPSDREQQAAMAAAIRGSPNLEELQFHFNPDSFILDAIPPTLEHLSFRNDDRSLYDPEWTHSIKQVIEHVEDKEVWPRLRVVTYAAGKQWDNQERTTLAGVCDDRGVDLRSFKKPLGHFTGENEVGMVPVKFPRHIPCNTASRDTL